MEKALLEEHVRYGEARFKDKKLVRPFVNRIYQDLAELEEAMKTKTCEGCKYASYDDECEEYYYSSDTYECRDCYRSGYKDNFMAKDNA